MRVDGQYTLGSRITRRAYAAAISTDMASWYTKNLEAYYADDPSALEVIMAENALKLFPRLRARLEGREGKSPDEFSDQAFGRGRCLTVTEMGDDNGHILGGSDSTKEPLRG